jgi:hypothetical protein
MRSSQGAVCSDGLGGVATAAGGGRTGSMPSADRMSFVLPTVRAGLVRTGRAVMGMGRLYVDVFAGCWYYTVRVRGARVRRVSGADTAEVRVQAGVWSTGLFNLMAWAH